MYVCSWGVEGGMVGCVDSFSFMKFLVLRKLHHVLDV
jgi:hypothetical protein